MTYSRSLLFLVVLCVPACKTDVESPSPSDVRNTVNVHPGDDDRDNRPIDNRADDLRAEGQQQYAKRASAEQEREIRDLIEQLVFAEGKAAKEPLLSPGVRENSEEYRNRFKKCQEAFEKLSEYKELAFPFLVEHLNDDRQSIPFRNHYLGFSVGDACRWNLYYQLQDRPPGYSSYGYSRMGRDGQQHPKPYWQGTPFDESGGPAQWLDENKHLSYVEKQIKCLNWLLEKEKAIGAADAESYFVNILPLEIRILERKLEAGEDVQGELDRLRRIKDEKRVDGIPPELLPEVAGASK